MGCRFATHVPLTTYFYTPTLTLQQPESVWQVADNIHRHCHNYSSYLQGQQSQPTSTQQPSVLLESERLEDNTNFKSYLQDIKAITLGAGFWALYEDNNVG